MVRGVICCWQTIGLILFNSSVKTDDIIALESRENGVEMAVLVEKVKVDFHSHSLALRCYLEIERHWFWMQLITMQMNRIKVRLRAHAFPPCNRSRLYAISFQGHKTSSELCLIPGGFTFMYFSWQQYRGDVVNDFFKDIFSPHHQLSSWKV